VKKITKEELSAIYNDHTNVEACKMLGVSQPTLSRMVKKAGIPTKGSGNNRKYEIGGIV
jgi:predicted DNA-binding protein (UPF0251 family)